MRGREHSKCDKLPARQERPRWICGAERFECEWALSGKARRRTCKRILLAAEGPTDSVQIVGIRKQSLRTPDRLRRNFRIAIPDQSRRPHLRVTDTTFSSGRRNCRTAPGRLLVMKGAAFGSRCRAYTLAWSEGIHDGRAGWNCAKWRSWRALADSSRLAGRGRCILRAMVLAAAVLAGF